MPRIPPRLIQTTRLCNPLISQLLPICRSVDSAQAELRWLRQHAFQEAEQSSSSHSNAPLNFLHQYVHRRARGEPLQYILGSEFFGDLELQCRPGVLIPRQETASAITYLVRRLCANTSPLETLIAPANDDEKIRVLDLCTGSGCIPLLFQSEFFARTSQPCDLTLTAIDLSPTALQLAAENFRLQRDADNLSLAARQALQTASVIHMDILSPSATTALPRTDILLSNPPYISPRSFRSTTSRSVRRFEPRIALVPPRVAHSTAPGPSEILAPSASSPTIISQEDTFYPALLSHAVRLGARVFWFEVADFAQARRVVELADGLGKWAGLEIWRDWLDSESDGTRTEDRGAASEREGKTRTVRLASGRNVGVRGEGSGRSVFGWRRDVG